jgi:two-component system nitrogen regulation response regulator NtrX
MADVFVRPLAGRRVAAAIDRELGAEVGERGLENGGQGLYNHSPAMREVSALISRAATVRSGVTIRGEAGSGRQLVARSIHDLQRQGAPFVAVDCATFEADQLDTALFGTRPEHPKGLERLSRDSLVHTANTGTLYLKNLDEATTRVQMRLARLLRDREGTLAETDENVVINVRPMAGVEPGVETLVEEGRVRDDLFRRLSAVRIDMPPLRSRREDIPALANFFVRRICAGLRVPPKTLSRPALSLLAALPWRGNADELKTLLESVVTGLAGGRNIGLEDVLGFVRLDGGSVVVNSGTLRQARLRFEREYIAAVLEQHHGRISEAAKALGIQRTNLYRKMRTLRVGRDRRRRG